MGDKELDKLAKELAPLTRDERQRSFQTEAFAFVTGLVVCLGIWSLTGAGYFWPGWVLLFGGIDIARRAYTTFANPPEEPEELEELEG